MSVARVTHQVVFGDVRVTIERDDFNVTLQALQEYSTLREAVRRSTVGPDGRAPIAQTHEEAVRALDVARTRALKYADVVKLLEAVVGRALSHEEVLSLFQVLAIDLGYGDVRRAVRAADKRKNRRRSK